MSVAPSTVSNQREPLTVAKKSLKVLLLTTSVIGVVAGAALITLASCVIKGISVGVFAAVVFNPMWMMGTAGGILVLSVVLGIFGLKIKGKMPLQPVEQSPPVPHLLPEGSAPSVELPAYGPDNKPAEPGDSSTDSENQPTTSQQPVAAPSIFRPPVAKPTLKRSHSMSHIRGDEVLGDRSALVLPETRLPEAVASSSTTAEVAVAQLTGATLEFVNAIKQWNPNIGRAYELFFGHFPDAVSRCVVDKKGDEVTITVSNPIALLVPPSEPYPGEAKENLGGVVLRFAARKHKFKWNSKEKLVACDTFGAVACVPPTHPLVSLFKNIDGHHVTDAVIRHLQEVNGGIQLFSAKDIVIKWAGNKRATRSMQTIQDCWGARASVINYNDSFQKVSQSANQDEIGIIPAPAK